MGRALRVTMTSAAILAVGTSVAWASGWVKDAFVGGDGSITACVSNANGNVRLIDPSSATCKSSESTVTFNQKGQKGDQGPQGPAGVSSAYYAEGGGGVPVPVMPDDPNFDGGTLPPIAHLNLPAGKFAVTATVEFHNTSDTRAIVGCGFSGINAKVDLAPFAIESDTFVGPYESDVPSEVDLHCGSTGGSVVLNHFNSVAIQVDNLTIEN